MKRTTLFSATLLLGLSSPQIMGALLNLSQTPIFLGGNTPPNVFIQLDDSGSMDWEFMQGGYWEACAYDPNITGTPSLVTSCGTFWTGDNGLRSYGNGAFRNFNYIFNNANNVYANLNGNGCDSTWIVNEIEACPEAGVKDWRAFSSGLNQMYFNPEISYGPWLYNCTTGTACANASLTAARSYPVSGVTGYTSTRDLRGWTYEVWIDDKGYSGTRPLRGVLTNPTTGANGEVDLWDSHVTIQMFDTNQIKVSSTTYNPNLVSINPTTVLQATLTDTSACYNVLGSPDLVANIFKGTYSYTSTGADGCKTIGQAQQDFANWYQYNRRRSLAARGAIAYVITQYPFFRYAFNTINDAFFVQAPAAGVTDYTTQNNSILNQLMTMTWKQEDTPLRIGLDRTGQYYFNKLSGKPTPIVEACQGNYAILMTDGFWNDSSGSLTSGISDNDGDGVSKTLADVAYYYYKTDLSTLSNVVVPNAFDPATWQHMVTFTMAYGLTGNLVAGNDGWPTPALAINGNWGNPFSDDLAKVDDLWHAAFNTKGNYFGSQDPATSGTALASIFSNIALRNASNTSAAQNSTVLNTNSQVYQATFNTANWQGDVLAFPLSNTGVLNTTPLWSANCKLTGGRCLNPVGTNTAQVPNNRAIITRNWTGANNGIAFRWPANYSTFKVSGSLPTNMANFLANAPFTANTSTGSQITANQAYGSALVDYLRGVRGNEVQNGGSYGFRNRTSILGDIVDSNPVYIAPPFRFYPDTLEASAYSAFKTTYANRTPMLFVGANDGMLHGFNANTGAEIMGYIPGVRQIYQNLPALSKTTYTHFYYADGSPVEGDVYFSSAWHTIVASSLKNGGQGIYALDVTNPANLTEANAAQTYLWEFTDENDPDLGYVQGNVVIAKVRTSATTSKWAVIVGNGYNNSQADGFASTTGKAALYILFIEQGIGGNWVADTSYIKIPVGTGSVTTPNGLGAPYAIDINNDYVVDYVYAGDLQGNIWKFDLTNATPTNWKNSTTNLFTASFSTAGDQPITGPLVVGPHPNGLASGVMIYFGTGKYLEPGDDSTTGQTTQAFYGIWDKLNGTTVTKSNLLQQTITSEIVPPQSTTSYRSVSNSPIKWTTPNQNLGWYINLIVSGAASNNGERQVSQPVLRNKNVIFTTLIPNADVCSFGGSSWLMELNAENGGQPTLNIFDINNDGQFTNADYIDIGTNGNHVYVPAAGQKSTVGMTGTPAIMLAPDKKSETKVLSGSQGIGTVQENPATGNSGRQNWRQLY